MQWGSEGVCLYKTYEWIKVLLKKRGEKVSSEDEFRKLFQIKDKEKNIETEDISSKTIFYQFIENFRRTIDNSLDKGVLIQDHLLEKDGIQLRKLNTTEEIGQFAEVIKKNEAELRVKGGQMIMVLVFPDEHEGANHAINIEVDPEKQTYAIRDPSFGWFTLNSLDELEAKLMELVWIQYPKIQGFELYHLYPKS